MEVFEKVQHQGYLFAFRSGTGFSDRIQRVDAQYVRNKTLFGCAMAELSNNTMRQTGEAFKNAFKISQDCDTKKTFGRGRRTKVWK